MSDSTCICYDKEYSEAYYFVYVLKNTMLQKYYPDSRYLLVGRFKKAFSSLEDLSKFCINDIRNLHNEIFKTDFPEQELFNKCICELRFLDELELDSGCANANTVLNYEITEHAFLAGGISESYLDAPDSFLLSE
jgi:hypothetical protein